MDFGPSSGLPRIRRLKQWLLSAGFKKQPKHGRVFRVPGRRSSPGHRFAEAFFANNTFFWCLVAGRYFVPVPGRVVARKGSEEGREKIRKGMPDALDLLVICVEAGLGLDQAMLRVGQELAISHPDIHREFMQINLEQLAGKPRLEAWKSAAERTEIQEFSAFRHHADCNPTGSARRSSGH